MEMRDRAETVGRGWAHWCPAPKSWDEGECVTPHGIVTMYRQNDGGLALTILQFAHKGMLYDRLYEYEYSRRYCATLAKRFAEEVVTETADD